jgi:molybdopterin synthase catalytic subunit
MSLAAIREAPLSLDEALGHVSHPGAGGVATFLGVVRDSNDGRAVTRLEYEAYDGMAAAEMRRIGDEIEAQLPGVRVAALHRKGSLSVGDAAVICAASAPHRGEAFEACRLLIDRIKARVPIWKREHGPDGAYWVGWQDARCGEGVPGGHGHQHQEHQHQEHQRQHGAHDHRREPPAGG